jgi:hypothetical protein
MADNAQDGIEALLKEATVEAATSLSELAETTQSKDLRKAARRALYLLGARGIRPNPPVGAVASVVETPTVETLRAYATSYDGAGNRILFFEIAAPDGGKPTVVQMLTNDLTGLQTSDSARLTREDLRHRIQQLEQLQAEGLAFVEIPQDYGRWLLEEARELLRRQSKPSPPGVLELLPRLGVARRDYLVSPVYEAIAPESLPADPALDRDPAALFALKWFENWFFAVEDVLRSLEAWEQAAEIPESASDDTVAAVRDAVVREVATTLFTPGVRSRYVRRLEETADVLRRLSHEDDARLALIHAKELAADGPVADVPFARALVERTLVAGLAIRKEQRAEPPRRA